jgi:hypothetical protein
MGKSLGIIALLKIGDLRNNSVAFIFLILVSISLGYGGFEI